MQFFVEIAGELAKVQVARLPKDQSLLALFHKTNGSTYVGVPVLFNGLRPSGKLGLYTAISVKLNKNSELERPPIEQEAKSIIPLTRSYSETNVEESFGLLNCIHELESQQPVKCSCPKLEPVPNDIEFRKYNFVFDYEQVSTTGNQNEAWITYANEKGIWIKRFGSENLRLAQEMCCKCDNRYIVERALQEFKEFEIHEVYELHELDTPDMAILRFLKKNAFTPSQMETIRKYRSRIIVGWHYDNEQVAGEEVLVIRGFLGMCDLVCSLSEYIVNVDQRTNSRM